MKFRTIFFLTVSLLFSYSVYTQDFIQVSGIRGCVPDTVSFTLNSDSIDFDTLNIGLIYMIGTDNFPITNNSPINYIIKKAGDYDVRLVSGLNTNDVITQRTVSFDRGSISADFEAVLVEAPYIYAMVPSDALADDASSYFFRWAYYDEANTSLRTITKIATTANQDNATDTFEFPDYGNYLVTLNLRNSPENCYDSTAVEVEVTNLPVIDTVGDTTAFPVQNFFIPEEETYYTITPDDPGVILSFKLFTRTGVLVFAMESPEIYWDGRNFNGQNMETGVYYYVLEAVSGAADDRYNQCSFIHLYR
ncbi:MAG: gliding motility-associated C-terminal domain-containing protein [Bacteroidales bacterium]|nr:gliding motility-associated C-terminal domain-containing protein [Bacteroidales bacterium]MBN2818130.1 gliding motility-associated C-terminal domain-containing protein [Bacteroidales bacterium]